MGKGKKGGCRGGSCTATLLLTQNAISVARRTVDEFAVRPGILLQSTYSLSLLFGGALDRWIRTGGPSGSRMFVSHLIIQPHLSRRLASRVRYRSGLPFSFFPLDLAPHGRTSEASFAKWEIKLPTARRGFVSVTPCLARVCALVIRPIGKRAT